MCAKKWLRRLIERNQVVTKKTTDTFCTGKRGFRSYSAAAKGASKASRVHDERYRPYKCEDCGFYHYGQTDRRPGKELRLINKEMV